MYHNLVSCMLKKISSNGEEQKMWYVCSVGETVQLYEKMNILAAEIRVRNNFHIYKQLM